MEISVLQLNKLIDAMNRIATVLETFEETVHKQDIGEHLDRVADAINAANPL